MCMCVHVCVCVCMCEGVLWFSVCMFMSLCTQEEEQEEEEEMQKRIAHQPMMERPRGGMDGRRGRDDWASGEHGSRPAPPTKIDAERFRRVATAGVSCCGKLVLYINCIPSCVCVLLQ